MERRAQFLLFSRASAPRMRADSSEETDAERPGRLRTEAARSPSSRRNGQSNSAAISGGTTARANADIGTLQQHYQPRCGKSMATLPGLIQEETAVPIETARMRPSINGVSAGFQRRFAQGWYKVRSGRGAHRVDARFSCCCGVGPTRASSVGLLCRALHRGWPCRNRRWCEADQFSRHLR